MGERNARHRRGRAARAGGTETAGAADATVPVPDDDPAAIAVRRLQRALGGPAVAAGPPAGWVPTRPPPQDHPAVPPPVSPPVPPPLTAAPRLAAVTDRLPVRLQSAVVAPAGRAVVAVLVLVLVAVIAAAVTTWLARPRELPAPARARLVGAPLSAGGSGPGVQGSVPGGGSGSPSADPLGAATSAGGPLVVHVVGAVRHPGVVELPAGSRVADAVAAVGGLTRRGDPGSVNLARPAVDGEQVVVGRRGAAGTALAPPAGGVPAAPAAPGAPAVPAPTAPVDLNTATLEQLDGLPGIGPVLAQRILDWRTANGRFSTVEELGEVSGIGEATLGDLRPLVTV